MLLTHRYRRYHCYLFGDPFQLGPLFLRSHSRVQLSLFEYLCKTHILEALHARWWAIGLTRLILLSRSWFASLSACVLWSVCPLSSVDFDTIQAWMQDPTYTTQEDHSDASKKLHRINNDIVVICQSLFRSPLLVSVSHPSAVHCGDLSVPCRQRILRQDRSAYAGPLLYPKRDSLVWRTKEWQSGKMFRNKHQELRSEMTIRNQHEEKRSGTRIRDKHQNLQSGKQSWVSIRNLHQE